MLIFSSLYSSAVYGHQGAMSPLQEVPLLPQALPPTPPPAPPPPPAQRNREDHEKTISAGATGVPVPAGAWLHIPPFQGSWSWSSSLRIPAGVLWSEGSSLSPLHHQEGQSLGQGLSSSWGHTASNLQGEPRTPAGPGAGTPPRPCSPYGGPLISGRPSLPDCEPGL